MAHYQVNALEDAARSTGVWMNDLYVDQPRFGNVIKALIPAALILAATTALLLILL
jgi:hypothetical protein